MFDKFIADYREIDPRLMPHLPYILQDLWAPGSSVNFIIQAVQSLSTQTSEFRALDPGCGKGAISVRLAEAFEIRVLGIDVMTFFLGEAREKARDHRLEQLYDFQLADLHDFLKPYREFNLVIPASLGEILGD